jgi:hypothetical protein
MRVGGGGGSGTLIDRSLCDLPVFVQCPPADDRVSVRVRVFRPCGVSERSLPTRLRRSSCSRHGGVVPEVPRERLGIGLCALDLCTLGDLDGRGGGTGGAFTGGG